MALDLFGEEIREPEPHCRKPQSRGTEATMGTKDEEKLLDRVAAHYRQMLGDSLPRVGEAIDADQTRQASFSVTVTFAKDKKGVVTARIMPRERIPLPGIELKLEVDDGQLALFGGHGAPTLVPPQKDMGEDEDESTPATAH